MNFIRQRDTHLPRSKFFFHTIDIEFGQTLEDQENLMPHILDCVRSYATPGEICDELRAVYGVYREPAF